MSSEENGSVIRRNALSFVEAMNFNVWVPTTVLLVLIFTHTVLSIPVNDTVWEIPLGIALFVSVLTLLNSSQGSSERMVNIASIAGVINTVVLITFANIFPQEAFGDKSEMVSDLCLASLSLVLFHLVPRTSPKDQSTTTLLSGAVASTALIATVSVLLTGWTSDALVILSTLAAIPLIAVGMIRLYVWFTATLPCFYRDQSPVGWSPTLMRANPGFNWKSDRHYFENEVTTEEFPKLVYHPSNQLRFRLALYPILPVDMRRALCHDPSMEVRLAACVNFTVSTDEEKALLAELTAEGADEITRYFAGFHPDASDEAFTWAYNKHGDKTWEGEDPEVLAQDKSWQRAVKLGLVSPDPVCETTEAAKTA